MRLFFIFMLAAHAAVTPDPCRPGALADDATTAYVQLLHSVTIDKRRIDPELLAEIAKSETPINPVEFAREAFGHIEAAVYEKAFGSHLKEGVNWGKIRAAARELIAKRTATDAKRDDVVERTGSLLAPFVVVPNLSAGTNAKFEHYPETSSSADGTIYVTATESQQVISFKNGKVESVQLPRDTKIIRMVKGPAGEVYAVCFAYFSTSVIELSTGKSVAHLEGQMTARNEPYVTIAREPAGMRVRVVHTDGGETVKYDVLPFGVGRGFSHPLSKDSFGVHEGPDGKIYASQMVMGRLRMWDIETNKQLFNEPFELMQGRSTRAQVRLVGDANGGMHVIAQEADGTLVHHDIKKGTVARPFQTKGQIHYEARVTPADGKPRFIFDVDVEGPGGRSMVVFNSDTGTFTAYPNEGAGLGRGTFTASDGIGFAVQQGKYYVGGTEKSRLLVQNIETGEVTKVDTDHVGLADFHSVESTPDGRAYALMKTKLGAFALVQIYGPTPKP